MGHGSYLRNIFLVLNREVLITLVKRAFDSLHQKRDGWNEVLGEHCVRSTVTSRVGKVLGLGLRMAGLEEMVLKMPISFKGPTASPSS